METRVTLKNRHGLSLAALLIVPEAKEKPPVVAFAHGWGSSKSSPRNRGIADALVDAGIAAFLFDFTGHGDSEGDANATGLREQSDDLTDALDFLAGREELGAIGVAGSSSGGAVALAVAARDPRVRALVLRAPSADSKPDDAAHVRAPALLVQGEDDGLLERNRELAGRLAGEHRLCTVAGAGHLFEEPGTFGEAKSETVHWFERWLLGARTTAGGQARPRSRAARTELAPTHFVDRAHAGRELARRLLARRGGRTLVLALPRGGITVAEPIARALGAELDVFVSRKVRAPGQPELAIGAVAEDDVVVWNEDVLTELAVGEKARTRELERSRRELDERLREYRAVRPRAELTGRTVIVVDDGVATGATLRAAIVALGRLGVAELVVALPGGASDTLEEIARMPEVRELVALARPEPFFAVGQIYDDFSPVSSAEVCDVLRGFGAAPSR
ncbi:MAG: alpha/beta fold hydrolase [Myxococcota bacterium]